MVQDWFDRQMAGDRYIITEQKQYGYENYFVKLGAVPAMHGWYYNKVFLYDNTITLDENGAAFSFEILSDTAVKISWNDRSVVCTPEGIETENIRKMTYDTMHKEAEIHTADHRIGYRYKGARYGLSTNGSVSFENDVLTIRGDRIRLTPERAEQPV
jgi:hypothetical protein